MENDFELLIDDDYKAPFTEEEARALEGSEALEKDELLKQAVEYVLAEAQK